MIALRSLVSEVTEPSIWEAYCCAIFFIAALIRSASPPMSLSVYDEYNVPRPALRLRTPRTALR